MKRIALLTMLLSTPVAAQNVEDCDGRAFSLRPFPRAVVERDITARDPNRVVGIVHARCEPGETEAAVCANVFRVNRRGYLSDEHFIFGYYNAVTSRFIATMSGPYAPQACAEHVYTRE